MKKINSLLYPILLVSYMVYAAYFKATLPDALVIGILGALNAWTMYMSYNKKQDISQEILRRLEECESTVNSMSLTNIRGLDNVTKSTKEKFVW